MVRKKLSIADIARATGLSRATIDRVLNGRGGVKTETARRIQDAIVRLGYSPSAAEEFAGAGKKQIEVLLSEGTNPFFGQLRAAFEEKNRELDGERETLRIRTFDPYDPETVVRSLQSVDEATEIVITIGVDTQDVQLAIDDLVDHGKRIVTIISDVPQSKRAAYVGQDNFMAGRTAARLMLGCLSPEPSMVAILIGHLHFRHLLDRQSGFQQVLGLERPDVDILLKKPYGTKAETASDIIDQLAALGDDLKGIYLAGGGQPYLIEKMGTDLKSLPVIIGHEATAVSRRQLIDGKYRFVLAHDVRQVAHRSFEAAFSSEPPRAFDTSINIFVKDNFPDLL